MGRGYVALATQVVAEVGAVRRLSATGRLIRGETIRAVRFPVRSDCRRVLVLLMVPSNDSSSLSQCILVVLVAGKTIRGRSYLISLTVFPRFWTIGLISGRVKLRIGATIILTGVLVPRSLWRKLRGLQNSDALSRALCIMQLPLMAAGLTGELGIVPTSRRFDA